MSKPFASRRLRAFTMIEVEVSLILAALAAVTLASLVAQQTRIARRIAGPFGTGGELHLVAAADPLLRQLGVPAEILTHPPIPEPLVTPIIPSGDIQILTVDSDEEVLMVVADILPSSEEGSP